MELDRFEGGARESDAAEGSDDVAESEVREGKPREGCGEGDALH